MPKKRDVTDIVVEKVVHGNNDFNLLRLNALAPETISQQRVFHNYINRCGKLTHHGPGKGGSKITLPCYLSKKPKLACQS